MGPGRAKTSHSGHSGGMTHPHSIDDTFRVDGDDPREFLAAVSGAFHDVPERSLLIAGIDYDGSFISAAKLRMDDGPIFHILEAAVNLAFQSVRSGASSVICAVIGDISTTVTGINLPADVEALDEHYPRRLARWLAREIAACELPIPAVAYYFDGEEAGMGLVGPGGVREWERTRIGSLHDSVYAARMVTMGHSFALDAGPRFFVSPKALEDLAGRWAAGAAPSPRALGPSVKESYEQHLPDAFRNVTALIEAGAVMRGWLRDTSGPAAVKKYELLENLVFQAETKPGRDAVHFALIRELYPDFNDLDGALASLFEDPHYFPSSDISPGGSLYFLSRLPAVVLSGLRGKPLDPRIEKGLVNLACNHALLTWWAGRLGEANEAAQEVLMRDPSHEMGQYVSCIIDAGVLPAWLSARVRGGAHLDREEDGRWAA